MVSFGIFLRLASRDLLKGFGCCHQFVVRINAFDDVGGVEVLLPIKVMNWSVIQRERTNHLIAKLNLDGGVYIIRFFGCYTPRRGCVFCFHMISFPYRRILLRVRTASTQLHIE